MSNFPGLGRFVVLKFHVFVESFHIAIAIATDDMVNFDGILVGRLRRHLILERARWVLGLDILQPVLRAVISPQ